jgi:KipI family sensor histidine kinase inhibitor
VTPNFKPIADTAVLVEFENQISEQVNDRVLAFLASLEQENIAGVIEAVPAYRTLLVYYDGLQIDYAGLTARLERLTDSQTSRTQSASRWQVPVWYGGPASTDLADVASRHGLSEEQVIKIHSGALYRVYLVGFAPGWTFLGGLDERIHTPRLDSPRAEVPEGSISIGGQQGLICGPAMPSGWNLIGQTPERTWAPERDEPFFIQPGDQVEIRRIDEKEFVDLKVRVKSGERVSEKVVGVTPSSRPGAEP